MTQSVGKLGWCGLEVAETRWCLVAVVYLCERGCRSVRGWDTRRKQLAEAAEKRQKENVHRGIKNPESVERKKKKQEEMEKQQMNSSSTGGGGGLRWQVG
ncbi:small VCP/p97-interacting protein isoform X1 [Narcine bancroftii]|uniref:small VCP/p97-interacting protein isoform X1 n=1 Tax=Narcine bancroftii TaxID=1343680 RepID=UPI00383114BF